MAIFPKLPKLPDHCHICMDPIRLYQPYYTMRIDSNFMSGNHMHAITILCPNCYHAYENFIIERTTQENHKRTMREVKGENNKNK